MRRKFLFLMLAFVLLSLGFAQDGSVDVGWSLDMVWLLVSAALVFFMQAGFAW
ncbi:hypothetical protein [Thermotoga neapolitana]|uniref:hypothetical protein n=1 Tax=Thermotoga neapolitana TaxID=2337 RepID=UPI000B0F69BF|nr:hypothetical protein [Thermotoga neapolitana]